MGGWTRGWKAYGLDGWVGPHFSAGRAGPVKTHFSAARVRSGGSACVRMWDGLSPSHISGCHWDSPNQHKRAVPRRGHGAKSLTQHRHAGPSANSGSVDTVPEPSGCTPLSLSSCDHRQAALSASGCECSLPDMAMKTCKKFWCPNPPNRGTRPQERRRHGICRVERELAELCRSKAASCIP